MSGDRVTLAEVLDPHTVTYPVAAGWKCCLCGWEGIRVGDHLADIIRDHLTALARDAGVREVVGAAVALTAVGSGDDEAEMHVYQRDADAAVAAFLGCVR